MRLSARERRRPHVSTTFVARYPLVGGFGLREEATSGVVLLGICIEGMRVESSGVDNGAIMVASCSCRRREGGS